MTVLRSKIQRCFLPINGVPAAIERTINGFIRMLNGAIGIINAIPGVSISKVTLLSIPRLAEGGMVNAGQVFMAREAGPELVGTIGNRTAVVNNGQIVDAVSEGVYRAVVSAMGQSGGETAIYIDGRRVFEVVKNYNNRERIRTGVNPLMG